MHSARTPDSTPRRTLGDALAEGTVLLDGGLSNQLEAQGCDLSDALWSARLLSDAPQQIEAAHAAYARAGAQVLITASYQATFEGFARRGIGRAGAAELMAASVESARRAGAGAETGRELWVAASVGPYGAMLADGSEYRGRYGLTVRELERFHRPRAEALAGAGPDVMALETVPDIDEAEALLRAVEGLGVPVWLSYSVDGDRTRAGQPLEEAFALVSGVDQVVAVGVNCCDPADAGRAVEMAAATGKPVVVYPNSGEEWGAGGRGWTGKGTFEAGRVREWQRAGARLVGGCCRVGPSDIAALAGRLASSEV
nr:homocysteine S-methyltransferase [Streptomyces sp. NBC_01175]